MFILILFFIDIYLTGSVAEFFVRNILEDIEEVKFLGVSMVRGTFRWDRFRDILIFLVVGGFLILEISIYMASKLARIKERKKTIEEIENRLRELNNDKNIKSIKEFKFIDTEVQSILNQKENMKKEKELEIQKKNDVVTYLAHDLKTPLTSIIGYLNILEDSKVPIEIQSHYLKKVLDKAYHLEELTDQFFDITRFNLQEIPLNKSEIDGNFLLEQITDELYPLFKDKNLQLEFDIQENLILYADGKLLARVLNNLFKNAISYSNSNSVIIVSAKEEKNKSIIKIKNSGSIISQEELKMIFEKFYRRDSSREQSSGSGLGLAIAKEIVERHNGRLESESVNGETTFEITLPKSL